MSLAIETRALLKKLGVSEEQLHGGTRAAR